MFFIGVVVLLWCDGVFEVWFVMVFCFDFFFVLLLYKFGVDVCFCKELLSFWIFLLFDWVIGCVGVCWWFFCFFWEEGVFVEGLEWVVLR